MSAAVTANSQHLTHVTRDGERFDQLAWKYYGDPTLYAPIVQANFGRGVITPVFKAGVVLAIPILVANPAPSPNDLPPWKRQQ